MQVAMYVKNVAKWKGDGSHNMVRRYATISELVSSNGLVLGTIRKDMDMR